MPTIPAMHPISPALEQANEVFKHASATFSRAQDDYRARRSTDAKFLAARAIFSAALADWDRVFAEQSPCACEACQ